MVDAAGNLISCILSVVVICVIGVTNTNIKIDKYLNSIMIYNMAKIPPDPASQENGRYIIMDDGNGRRQAYYWYAESGREQQRARAAFELQQEDEQRLATEASKSDDTMVAVKQKKCCVLQNQDKNKFEW